MNRPTPTEAHYDLRRQVIFSDPDQGAQLIADSEARATRKQIEALEITTRRWLNVEKERDELRAEMERLRDDRDCEKRLRKAADEFRENANARAERAEADLAAAKERLRSEAMDDYASIKDLQRELATERARLNHVLRNDWPFRDRKAIDAAMKEDAK